MAETREIEAMPRESSLDPENWSTFRALAHRMVDEMLDHLEALSEKPIWQEIPDDVERLIADEPLPILGQGEQAAYEAFHEFVLPYPNGNLHPRFYGWVQGSGLPLANMADMLASAMNPHMAGFRHAPILVEEKLIAWIAEIMGFPPETSGVLESGGTMANVIGLAVARHSAVGKSIRTGGLQKIDRPCTIYCSSETHGWIHKGVDLLGIGTDWLRSIAVDQEFRMDLGALSQTVAKDRADGFHPICVVGSAGTVNTGAVDDLNGLADFCERQGLWFHVDGAYGAWAKLSCTKKGLVDGMERAESLAVDLHRSTFSFTPSYLAGANQGYTAGGLIFSDRGIDLTRGFKALKAWMCLKAYGVQKFSQLIDQNLAQTQALVARIGREPNMELLAPTPFNVVCFRHRVPDEAESDSFNRDLLRRVQDGGVAILSSTTIHSRFALRFCHVNHRSKLEDIDILLDEVLRHGSEIGAQ
jgi:glutamate/tyrosine decarboxylase-like PLP-dependent enzyme